MILKIDPRHPEYITSLILDEVAEERINQRCKGYDAEHDDNHSYYELLILAARRANTLSCSQLIKAIAILVAVVEKMDRDSSN